MGSLDLPLLAGCLKVANPFVRIIGIMSQALAGNYVDTLLEKPVNIETLLNAIHQNLAIYEASTEPS